MNKRDFYIINRTNMHVGSGNYGAARTITEIQKDYYDYSPIISATGLKGSIRQSYIAKKIEKIDYVLGSEEEASEIVFIDAKTLLYPVRSINYEKGMFFYITKDELEEREYLKEKKVISKVGKIDINELQYIENVEIKKEDGIEQIEEFNVLKVSEKIFKDILKIQPIITRNKIKDNESENVWSEEYVPRFTVMKSSYFYENQELEAFLFRMLEEFDTNKLEDLIQIGANSSIGMGYCQIMINDRSEDA